MKIEFCVNGLNSFLPGIAHQLGLKVENSGFKLPDKLGRGFFSEVHLSPDILITYYELFLYENTTVLRKKSRNDDIVPIIFWVSTNGITQTLSFEEREIGNDTPNGIFMPSHEMEPKYIFPSMTPIKNLTLFVKKKWLREYISDQNDFINNHILSNSGYFIFEEITFDMQSIIDDIQHTLKNNNMKFSFSKIGLLANTLKLLHQFLQKLSLRSVNTHIERVNPIDIQRLFKTKAVLSQNYVVIPSIENLAKESGMNKRKMQRLFKLVFGVSIYQFALAVKMREAHKMLRTKKYSVSEVGHQVGYSNLSHFTEQFKNQFGITPKSLLASE